MTSVITRLLPGDPRSGHARTVADWLRGEDGGAWLRDEKDAVVTMEDWLRGGGNQGEFKSRLMPQINRFAKRDLAADEVLVRGSYVCNSERDYYYSRFGRPALEEAAELIVGKPKMRMHNYKTGEPEGRTFDAEVVHRAEPGKPKRDSYWLKTLWYTLANDDGKRLVERVDGGLDDQVSISWACAGAECSECADPIFSCRHIPGDIYARGICDFEFSGLTRVLEDSFVFQGGQKNTTNFIPESSRAESMAAVASAVNRFLEGCTGEMRWDVIGERKREFLFELDRMPREIRVAAETYRRAMGMGTLCAEPGERRNTQAIACSKERFVTVAAAARYVRDHDFRADRRSMTDHDFVFTQFAEDRLEPGSAKDRGLDPGVKARVGTIKAAPQDGARDGAHRTDDTDAAVRDLDDWLKHGSAAA